MQSIRTPCQRESLPFSRAGTVRRNMTANITGRSMTSEVMAAMVAFYSSFYSAFSTFLALG